MPDRHEGNLITRSARFQPYPDHNLGVDVLLSFVRRQVTLLDPDFNPEVETWATTTEERDWEMITVRTCGNEQGYKVTQADTLESRASGLVGSSIEVEVFGLSPGCELWIKHEWGWNTPTYLEMCVKGPGVAVQAIEDAFLVEFEPKQEQPPDEATLRSERDNAEASLKAGDWADAEACAAFVVKWQPENLDAIFILGSTLLGQRKFDRAEYHLRTVVMRDPNRAAAWYNLGNAMLETDRLSQAEYFYLRAAELAPEHRPTFYGLGATLEKLGCPSEGLAAYRRAVRRDLDSVQVEGYVGPDVEEQAREAVARLESMGSASAQGGDGGEVSAAMSEQQEVITRLNAQLYLKAGLWASAERHARALLRAKPDDLEASRILGTALLAQDRLVEAEGHLLRVLEGEPENFKALYNLGSIYLARDELEKALDCFRRALELTSDKHLVYFVIGQALEKLGRLEGALEAYRSAERAAQATVGQSGNVALDFSARASEAAARLEPQVTKSRLEKQSFYEAKVARAIASVLNAMEDWRPPIVDHIFFGALDIDPRHLSAHFAYEDNAALKAAEESGHLAYIKQVFLAALEREGYPAEALPHVRVGIVSKQEVEGQGGPWIYFR